MRKRVSVKPQHRALCEYLSVSQSETCKYKFQWNERMKNKTTWVIASLLPISSFLNHKLSSHTVVETQDLRKKYHYGVIATHWDCPDPSQMQHQAHVMLCLEQEQYFQALVQAQAEVWQALRSLIQLVGTSASTPEDHMAEFLGAC